MSERQTVTINGRAYDAVTGLPIMEGSVNKSTANRQIVSVTVAKKPNTAAYAVHSRMQHSKTLNRRLTKKPQTPAKPTQTPVHSRTRTVTAKSPAITRFAPHPKPAAQPPRSNLSRTMMDIALIKHPSVTRAHQVQAQRATMATTQRRSVVAPVPANIKPTQAAPQPAQVAAPQPVKQTAQVAKPGLTPSQMIKNQAIENALRDAPSKKEQAKAHKKSFFARHPRVFSIASASLAVALLAGYFTYLNMPSLSVRVAAAQAGIDASYPEYRPDGYSLNGPVAATDGKVQMKFASNSGTQNFVVTQEKSSWDSSAVMDNIVKPQSNDSYITTNERGLTIYTFDGNAAWVNGGILYTIQGDAPLSSEQIRRIATSL